MYFSLRFMYFGEGFIYSPQRNTCFSRGNMYFFQEFMYLVERFSRPSVKPLLRRNMACHVRSSAMSRGGHGKPCPYNNTLAAKCFA